MNNIFETEFNNQYLMLYLIMALCSVFIYIEVYVKKNNSIKLQWFLTLVFGLIFIFFFGLRNFAVGIDTITYVNFFLDDTILTDIGFYVFNKSLRDLGFNAKEYIFFISLTYISFILLFLKISKFKNVFLVFFCFVSLFFFRSMGTNILRTGIAMSLFLYSYTVRSRYLKLLLFIITITLHSSFIIPILAFYGTILLKSAKIPIVIFAGSFVLSLLKLPIYDLILKVPVINKIFIDKIASYNAVDADSYKIGFRPDFFLFNLFFAIVGYFGYQHFSKKNENIFYVRTYYLYLILSGFFFLMFNSGFSDRYGLFSWGLIPILVSPFFENIKIKSYYINKTVILIVCFFLGIIFYGVRTN